MSEPAKKSGLFHIIEDAQAVLAVNGIYKQVKVYRRRSKGETLDRLYAGWAGGYIYLMKKGTSVPKVRLEELDLPFEPVSKMERLYVPEGGYYA